MSLLPFGVKQALDVAIQRSHDADPRKHGWPSALGNKNKGFHCGLPLFGVVFHLGQFGDVERGVAERG